MRFFGGVILCALVAAAGGELRGQGAVSPRNLYERVYAVVPMVGSGTYEDSRRPMFAPYGEGRWTDRRAPEITGFSYVVSDDGRFALVEFVARDKRAFDGLMGSGRADVKVFRRGRARKEEVEQEFRKHKKDFDWERFWKHFGVVAR